MKRLQGFTLIELMIVVAVIAILVAIAYPAYKDQVTRTRRAEGKAAATQMAAALERCYTINNAYNAAACAGIGGATISENKHYSVSAAVTATTFTVTAAPQGAQAADDSACGSLTVNQLGQKTPNPASSDCWKR
ncbi:MAG: prepilin-type N-terminal cleavage/methylation domain-containing protein [Xanthomonadales bacterium]|nr:prepilin-type N-terminal cleavage/methylation domain-containing protein [Xanthomonadales bacterium]